MAIDTTTPPKAPLTPADPDRPAGKALPMTLLAICLGLTIYGVATLVRYVIGVETSANQETKFVFRRLEEAVKLFGREVSPSLFWVPVLGIVLALGFVYVVWMYTRDGKAVGWAWATFLAYLRLTVYTVLAFVFLLPALQTWEKHESSSKVLMFMDVSGSMNLSDEVSDGNTKLRTRMNDVLKFFTKPDPASKQDQAFVRKLLEKNPITLYRFGGRLDEEARDFRKDAKLWTEDEWTAWSQLDLKQWLLDELSDKGKENLRQAGGFDPGKPGTVAWAADFLRTGGTPNFLVPADKDIFDKKKKQLPKQVELQPYLINGTNYADSLTLALNRESNNMLAGIIIVGDGQSNQGSPSTLKNVAERAFNLKVPIFCIGVGEYRELINIRITDLQSPEQAPPDEKFMIRAEVDGEGWADKEIPVTLESYKPGDKPGEAKPTMQRTLPCKIKATGGTPHGQVEYLIDPEGDEFGPMREAGKKQLLQGEWKFIVRTPKVKGESFAGKEHVSDVASVQIIDRPLRVLLFAGGPMRDYQFCRRMFVNEVDKKRAEMSICLQVTDPKGQRVQDVPPERLLAQFPNILRVENDPGEKAEDKYYNLAQYDVIIAYDPDWTQISTENLVLLQKWVELQGSGLILIGGPVNTYQLARGVNSERLRPIIDLYPVRVEDSRFAGQGVERPTNEPWKLNFPGATDETEFLKLDDESKNPLPGWSEFFYGKYRPDWMTTTDHPTHGFYTYYPVKSTKPNATTVATFTDPKAYITKDDSSSGEQPYLVTMPFGRGKVVYISSGEMWRLRQHKEIFHERFWTKLARYAASGALTRQTRNGRFEMAQKFSAGQYVRLSARMFGSNLEPLAMTAEPKVKIIPPPGVSISPNPLKLTPRRQGDWAGYFDGRVLVNAPGEYQLELPVPGSSEILRSKFTVKESNLELDNPRPNFALLHELASNVNDLRVNDASKLQLKRQLEGLYKPETKAGAREESGKPSETRLFFNLDKAALIPDYLSTDLKIQRTRGPINDLWPDGPEIAVDRNGNPMKVSTVLLVVVGLLSVEWLCRKLLKLA